MRTGCILSISVLLTLIVPHLGAAQGIDTPVAFEFRDMSLRASLDSLMKWYPVSIVYLDRDVEGKTVSVSCTGCDFEDALTAILNGTSLMWIMTGNQVILKQRPAERSRPVATLAGVVRDSLTGEQVADANVLLLDSTVQETDQTIRRWCPTNEFGFYSLRQVPPGTYLLSVRAVGYKPVLKPLVIAAEGPLREDIALAQENIAFQEVTVEGHRSPFAAATGVSRGVYIRSAPADQNQYLLDGARVYNPSHFGGVLSTFNAEALNDVQSLTGSLPPYYGGRIGGILDLSLRDGTMRRISGTAGTGSLGSHLSLEGPVAGPVTFLLTARRGYPRTVVPSLKQQGAPARLGSSELIGKLSYRLSGSQRLSLSGYYGRDAYNNAAEGAARRLSNDFFWGNGTVNLRWTAVASSSLFLQASAVYTRYDLALDHAWEEQLPFPWHTVYSSEYGVEDLNVRAYAEHYYDDEHTVRGGVELVHHRMNAAIHDFSTHLAPFALDGYSAWELSVYVQDQWRILPRVTAELGARMTSFTGNDGTFSSVDPRFALLLSLNEETRCFAALTSVNQFVHPYRNSGVFLFYPSIFWYPSTEKVKPATALQITLGAERTWGENGWNVSADAFYRVTNNLHEFVSDTVYDPAARLDDLILFGTGKSYGMEFSLGKRTGDVSGSVRYIVSWNSNRFAELNGGAPFAPWFDRRHEVQMSVAYTPHDRWLFNALCVIASQQLPPSAPESEGALAPTFGADERMRPSTGVFEGSRGLIDVNGSRFPGFQRLELGASYRFPIGGFWSQVNLRLMNRYGLLDPFSWELRNPPRPGNLWQVRLRELSLFPLYPTVGVTVRF